MINDNWNMLGHEWAVELLQNHLANGRTRHAYLFSGPQGVGRRTLALRLTQAINCSEPPRLGQPCGECRNCELIENKQHPDLAIIQADQVGGNLKVNQIREVQHSLSLSPYQAAYRVAVLLRFEEANPSAANAMLKTLEEPPSRVVMMLTAQDPESLLPTIVSRCELIRLRPLSLDQIAEGLQTQFDLPSKDARLLAHISGGRPGRALQLHQDPSILERRGAWLEDHQKLLSANRVERFTYADALTKEKDSIEAILQVWSSFWRDVLLVNTGSSVPVTNIDWKPQIESLAGEVNTAKAMAMVQAIEKTNQLIGKNVNTRLTFEILMLDLPHI